MQFTAINFAATNLWELTQFCSCKTPHSSIYCSVKTRKAENTDICTIKQCGQLSEVSRMLQISQKLFFTLPAGKH